MCVTTVLHVCLVPFVSRCSNQILMCNNILLVVYSAYLCMMASLPLAKLLCINALFAAIYRTNQFLLIQENNSKQH